MSEGNSVSQSEIKDTTDTSITSKASYKYYIKAKIYRTYYPGDTFILKTNEWMNMTLTLELWENFKVNGETKSRFVKLINPRSNRWTMNITVWYKEIENGQWKSLPYNSQNFVEVSTINRFSTSRAIHLKARMKQNVMTEVYFKMSNIIGPDVPSGSTYTGASYTPDIRIPVPGNNIWHYWHIQELDGK
jgi:hypothetical protein